MKTKIICAGGLCFTKEQWKRFMKYGVTINGVTTYTAKQMRVLYSSRNHSSDKRPRVKISWPKVTTRTRMDLRFDEWCLYEEKIIDFTLFKLYIYYPNGWTFWKVTDWKKGTIESFGPKKYRLRKWKPKQARYNPPIPSDTRIPITEKEALERWGNKWLVPVNYKII